MSRENPEIVDVSFSCNIDVSGVKVIVESHQLVRIKVPKHTLWNSGPALLPRLDFHPDKARKLSTRILQTLLLGEVGLINKMFLAPGEQQMHTMQQIYSTLSCRFRDCVRKFWKTTCDMPQVSSTGFGHCIIHCDGCRENPTAPSLKS